MTDQVSYSTAGFGDRNVEAALDAIAASGYDYAEIVGQEPHVAEPLIGGALLEFRARLEQRGLAGGTVHAPLTRNVLGAPEEGWRREKVEVLGAYLRFTADLGSTAMVIHPVPNPRFVPEPERTELPHIMNEAARRSLDDLVPLATEVGVRILLENLPYRCAYPLLDMTELRSLVEPYPPEALGLVIDTGHAWTLGNDPAEEIRAAGSRLWGTHLQDVDYENPQDDHWMPTHGGLDWGAVRAALEDVGYAGLWTFEVSAGRAEETPEELARLTRQVAVDWQTDAS